MAARNRDDACDLVSKLLRLAAPSSNTTQSERESAALEAARLINEYDLTVTTSAAAPKAPEAARSTVAHGVWVLTCALQYRSCSACLQNISPDDHVWLRIVHGTREYRHNYGKCVPG